MNELAKIDNYCELGKTSLTFKREVTQEEWSTVFNSLKMVEGCVQFWIGDCLAYREQKWGMYDDVSKESGYDKKTLRDIKRVSENVESVRRKTDLSFSHHLEVATLEPEKQIEFLDKASKEKLSVRELRNEIRRDSKPFEVQEPPQGTFNLIYCDPPWQYDFAETSNREIENQYPTMSVDDICSMELPDTPDDCLLLMWATAPKLLEALKVIEAWGFTYKTQSIWDKEKLGMGYWFRGQHEILIVATKGHFSPPEPEHRMSSIHREPRTGHSVKPDYYYEWIERSFPHTNKIELFSRNERTGWEAWGNE